MSTLTPGQEIRVWNWHLKTAKILGFTATLPVLSPVRLEIFSLYGDSALAFGANSTAQFKFVSGKWVLSKFNA